MDLRRGQRPRSIQVHSESHIVGKAKTAPRRHGLCWLMFPSLVALTSGLSACHGTANLELTARRKTLRLSTRLRNLENGYIESFNGRLRDECLNVELFWSAEDARAKLEKWRVDYNVHRPHSSLVNLPPAAFANELRQRKPTTNRELLAVENSS